MNTVRASYRRALVVGASAWALSTAILHWFPLPLHFDDAPTARALLLALADGAFFGAVVYALVRRRPAAERFPTTAAIALPVAFGDALGMAFWKTVFPQLNPDGAGMFAAFLLLTIGVVMATGLLAGSRHAP
jgi:hypothetical protein